MPRIDGFELQRQIGRGGSATVYLAREIKHDRLVALKVLHPALAASIQSERFLREISIVAKLSHPNILPLLDSGSAGTLLYYVTPYVAGESLRGLLQRGKLPDVREAVRLTREVADALEHAHRQGVIHRDIKPENILLADGHALVADFGIARAVRMSTDDRLTSLGIMPGTPRYMSPEQAGGDPELGPPADVYSLGCVLYELVTGAPPFVGHTASETVGQHMVNPVPAIAPRAGMTTGLEHVVRKALAKRAVDRYPTAAAFASALVDPSTLGFREVLRQWRGRGLAALILGMVAVVASTVFLVRLMDTSPFVSMRVRALSALGLRQVRLDTTAYLMITSGDAPSATMETVSRTMRNAMDRWRDVTVVDITDTIPTEPGQSFGEQIRRVRRSAYRAEAGRFVFLNLSHGGDSLRLTASLRDTRTGAVLASSELELASSLSGLALAAGGIADRLLLNAGPVDRPEKAPGTNSLEARRAYLKGHVALANGDFVGADSAFREALVVDHEYPQALIWLASTRSWTRGSGSWRELPARARGRRAALVATDSVLLEALLSFSADRVDLACREWARLTELAPEDFSSWYGLGHCLRADNVVVRDARARNGWRFRSSRHQSVKAFEQAFELRPNILIGFGGQALTELRQLMLTSGDYMVTGYSVPSEGQQFHGYTVWQGDSLALVPLPMAEIPGSHITSAMDEAVHQQRLRFRAIAVAWKAEYPRSPDAVEAVAMSLEMLGDESALDTLRHARALSSEADDRLRLAANEVLIRLKFSVPNNPTGIAAARRLADSLLAVNPPGPGVSGNLLASIAALLGRANLAASYARLAVGDIDLPALARTGPALLAFGSLGGPQDSLTALGAAVARAVASIPESQRATARRNWLTRAAVLAFPEARLPGPPDSAFSGLRLGTLILRAIAADTATVIRLNREIAEFRRWIRPSDLTADGFYPEAATLAAVGAEDLAAARVDPSLLSLQFTATQDLAFANRTGPLMRAMVLRANIAARKNDPVTARLWASAVVSLWSGADSFLQPVVTAMRHLAP